SKPAAGSSIQRPRANSVSAASAMMRGNPGSSTPGSGPSRPGTNNFKLRTDVAHGNCKRMRVGSNYKRARTMPVRGTTKGGPSAALGGNELRQMIEYRLLDRFELGRDGEHLAVALLDGDIRVLETMAGQGAHDAAARRD